jgi:hypothetical protein
MAGENEERLKALETSVSELYARLEHHEHQISMLLAELHSVKGDTSRILSVATKHGLVLDSLHRILSAGRELGTK